LPSSSPAMRPAEGVRLAPLTTLGVGGPARWFVRAGDTASVQAACAWAQERGCSLFVLGAGSNLVVADTGFDGVILQPALRGLVQRVDAGTLTLAVEAGEPWDDVVAAAVAAGFGGIDALSGIPGTAGAAPVQNIGAYGQELSDTLVDVTAVERGSGAVVTLPAGSCGLGYRRSRFREDDRNRFVITRLQLRLERGARIPSYDDLAARLRELGVSHPGPADIRRGVLEVRRSKAMVIDGRDPDARSVGSFFVNPQLTASAYAEVEAVAGRLGARAPGRPGGDGRTKVPAGWLIEHAGFPRGYTEGAVGLSSKHALAVTNRGGATARQVVELAARIKRRVADTFGVWLRPEPLFLGFGDDETVAFLRKANE